MNKVTKKELVERANEHEEAIFQIKKALEQHGIKWTEQPKLKQLDQSVFDGLDAKWRFAAVNICNKKSMVYRVKPKCIHQMGMWFYHMGESKCVGDDYDTTNWQNSLIERDKAELTGSDLCRAMRNRGDQFVQCIMSNDEDCINLESSMWPKVVVHHSDERFKCSDGTYWKHAIPINNQGEPLTQLEAGL